MRLLRCVVALLLATVTSLALARPAPAADTAAIRLVGQDLIVPTGGSASFTFTVSGSLPPETEVVVEAYSKFTAARADFQRLVRGELHNRDVGFVALSLDLLTADALGRYTVTLPTVTTPQDRVQGGNALLPDAGMYPVTIELRADNEPLAQIATTIVRLPADTASTPLDVALVLPIDNVPTLRADGTTVIDQADRARVQTIAAALAGSQTPLTLRPRPELVDGLARTGLPADAALRSSLAGAAAGRQILAAPYVDVDPTAAVRAGLDTELTAQLTEGEDALSAALGGVRADRSTWLADGAIGTDAVMALRELGVRRMVLSPAALDKFEGEPPTTPIRIGGGGSLPIETAVADPRLAAALTAGADPVLSAYQFVEQLLAVAVDRSADATAHGVVVVAPADWRPDGTFLATVLALLGHNPLLRPMTLDGWFTAATPPTDPPHALAAANPADLTGFATGLQLTRQRLDALASMLAPNDALAASLTARLRVANDATLAPPARQSYLDAVNGELNVLNDAVDPVPTRRITLAGRTTELPITIHRKIDHPIQVRVHLESPKLSLPDNDVLVTLDTETVQQRIPVRARANGTFPLTVSIMTPQGDVTVATPTELTVQSTTLSGFGVVLSVGALLVLATWWVCHIRGNRRRRAVAQATTHHPSTGPPAPAPST